MSDNEPRRHLPLQTLEPRVASRISLIAMATALGPFALQMAALVFTQSSGFTLVVALLLAVLFSIAGIALHARFAGSLRAVPIGSMIGIGVAVLTYQLLSLAVATLVNATFFAPGAR